MQFLFNFNSNPSDKYLRMKVIINFFFFSENGLKRAIVDFFYKRRVILDIVKVSRTSAIRNSNCKLCAFD